MTAPVAMRPAAARALSPVGPTMLDDRGGLVGDGLDRAQVAAQQIVGFGRGAVVDEHRHAGDVVLLLQP